MSKIVYKCPICKSTYITNYFSLREIQICDYCGKIDIKPYSISLDFYDLEEILNRLVLERKRRKDKREVSTRYIWTTKNNEEIYIDEMTESHLENTIKMMERKVNAYYEEVYNCEIF